MPRVFHDHELHKAVHRFRSPSWPSPNDPVSPHDADHPQSFPQTAFCPPCQNIFHGDPDRFHTWNYNSKVWDRHRFEHHRTVSSFKDALNQQCYICMRVFKEMDQETKQYLEGSTDSIPFVNDSAFTVFEVHLVMNPRSNKKRRIRAEADIWISCIGHFGDYMQSVSKFLIFSSKDYPVIARPPPSQTSSQQTIDFANQWLKKCSKTHDCDTSRIRDWHPTRVLDTGKSNSQIWRLCIPTQESIQILKYTTLSYRWGDGPFLKLTTANLPRFRAGMSNLDLPQSFQDAITMTQHLGIRYLWIDALCIIQDSEDDFNRECSMMSMVYTNSACNFAALASSDPFGGLFRVRKYEDALVGNFRPMWKSPDPEYIVLNSVDSIIRTDYFGREINGSPLRSRGWILQELILSPRVLYFGENQVYWECGSSEICEMFPNGIPHCISFQGSRTLLLHHYGPDVAFRQWTGIVEKYSACSLTMPSDKLMAISGLAQHFKRATGDVYVAGLWKWRLAWNLHWKKEGLSLRRALPYRAPTWSWASLDAQIRTCEAEFLSNEHQNPLVKIIDVTVETAGNDPTGSVISGKLCISAPAVVPLVKEANEEGDGSLRLIVRIHDWECQLRVSWDEGEDMPSPGVVLFYVVTFVVGRCTDFLDDVPHKLSGPTHWTIYGIMLRKLGSSQEQFVRVGQFEIYFRRSDGQSTESPELALFGLDITDEYGNVSAKDESVFQTFEII